MLGNVEEKYVTETFFLCMMDFLIKCVDLCMLVPVAFSTILNIAAYKASPDSFMLYKKGLLLILQVNG